MARAKKEAALTPEERLQAALVPDWEWPYKLPGNWCWTRITVITDILNGFAFKSQHYSSAGIRIIRITNVQDGFIQDKKPVYYPLVSQKEITPFMLKDGDFLMSLTGNVGRVAIIDASFLPAALNQRVACLRIKSEDSVRKEYIFYFCLQKQLLLNAMKDGYQSPNAGFAWEYSLLRANTKYLGNFYRGLQYIGRRIPEEGQAERLMLKYYSFMWQIRQSLYENYGITVLQNLEKFQEYTGTDEQDKQYYELVANAFSTPKTEQKHTSNTRFYIQKRTPFYVGKERYFEVTLQQADIYASKYNRITAYTKLDISTGYSVQIDYVPSYINLWGVNTEIKIITAWRVSVDPKCLNTLGKILNMRLQLSSKYGEYDALMRFLTETGMDFLEMIDLREIPFSNLLESVYKKAKTSYFKDVLQQLRDNYSTGSTRFGRYTIRYLLLNLREDLLERVMPSQFSPQWKCKDLYLSRKS